MALQATKNNRRGGPSGQQAELLKWLGAGAKDKLLQFYNFCIEERRFPAEWSKAEVVAIFKKGDRSAPKNYRPISLLESAYKIFAKIIAMRLDAALEGKIHCTQYGFRHKKSTSEPIHIIRRLQDMVQERRNQ
eukprot:12691056-Alexandrium_andersonii.AAC.1